MRTSLDLPEPLLRRARAAAARQGRPVDELVVEALSEKLRGLADALPAAANDPPVDPFDGYLASLVQQPDGSWVNPNGIEDEEFFRILDAMRHGGEHDPAMAPRDPFAKSR